MIKTSENTTDLFTALIKAQSEFLVAKKDVQNEFTKKNYADFQSVVEAVRPALTKNGLGFMQMPIATEAGLSLVTRIFHSSGQWYEGHTPVKSMKEDPQSMGAAITYFKRYSLQAALGVIASDEDSDAEKAMSKDDENRPASRGDVTNLLKAYQGLAISESRILNYIGAKHSTDLTVKDLENLKSIGSDIKNKKAKLEDYFPKEVAK